MCHVQLFGKLKGKEGAPKAPRDVANALIAALPANEVKWKCNHQTCKLATACGMRSVPESCETPD